MRNMSELWEMWAYLPPHQLEDTEHLPKFKGLRHQAGYNLPRELHRLDDLLDENDDLDPVLSLRNKPRADFNLIWDVGTETASADDIVMAAMEATAHDQIAAVTSDLAQAAAGALPLRCAGNSFIFKLVPFGHHWIKRILSWRTSKTHAYGMLSTVSVGMG